MAADTIIERLLRNAEQTPARPALYEKHDGAYRPVSWGEYAGLVLRAARALGALGFEPGSRAAIIGFNRLEWLVFDLACMAAGGIPSGIYMTSPANEVGYVVAHSGASVILVEDEGQLAKVLAVRDELPGLQWIVTMRGAPPHGDPSILAWEEFLDRAEGGPDPAERLEALDPEAPATVIYTSGTTGLPKGVVLTHSNLTWTADHAAGAFPLDADQRMISYLPLSHVAEQMYTIHVAVSFGYAVYFAESLETVRDDISAVRPTLFFGVPRVWEKMADGVGAKLAEASGLRARLAAWAMGVGRRAVAARNRGESLGVLPGIQYRVAELLFFGRAKRAMGFDACHFAVSGAAPLDPEVMEFLAGLDLPIHEVYGLSECCGPATWNRIGETRYGTVGPAYPGVEVKIAADGEVLVKGGNVFAGYLDAPEATAEALQGGWLHTGDLGTMDDGFLTIVGRKKDLIVTAGGRNSAPEPLEAGLKRNPLVAEAMVVGDQKPYLAALIALDPETLAEFAAAHGISGSPFGAPEVREAVEATLAEVNARVARADQIKKIAILPRPLSIEEGELTGTLKVRREILMERFADEVARLYEAGD